MLFKRAEKDAGPGPNTGSRTNMLKIAAGAFAYEKRYSAVMYEFALWMSLKIGYDAGNGATNEALAGVPVAFVA
jgi:hypothetical protein